MKNNYIEQNNLLDVLIKSIAYILKYVKTKLKK